MSDIKEVSTYELLKELERRREVCIYWVNKEDMCNAMEELDDNLDLTDDEWDKYWNKFVDNVEKDMDLDEVKNIYEDAFMDMLKEDLDIEQ